MSRMRRLIEGRQRHEAIEPELDEENWPADVERYYQGCMKKQPGKGKEYCSRVAWSIFCAHKNPDYPGCTEYGKKWGAPYSKPVSSAIEGCSPCEAIERQRQSLITRLLSS